jgi:hypothetical protein
MKLADIRKRLISRAVIAAVTLAISFGGAFAVFQYRTGLQEEHDSLNSTVTGMEADVSQKQEEYDRANASMDLYRSLEKKKSNADAALNRSSLQKVLAKLRDAYHLAGLSLKLTPVEIMEGDIYKREHVGVTKSTGSIEFTAVTDAYAYSMLDVLRQRLEGYVRYTLVSLERQRPINQDALIAASRGEYPTSVGVRVQFDWMGLRETPKETPQAAETGNASPAP